MHRSRPVRWTVRALGTALALAVLALGATGCSEDQGSGGDAADTGRDFAADAGDDAGDVPDVHTDPEAGPPAGNPNPEATCSAPAEAQPADVSSPRTVVGTGTPASCTSDAFVGAVALGGVITFNCGAEPTTIVLDRTAKIFNDTGPEIVIDGGGLITLSGGGRNRILYMNTCDEAQVWTTSHCQNQDHRG